MAQLQFEFNKPFDTVEINGKEFKLYFDDDSLKKYRDKAKQYQTDTKEFLAAIPAGELTQEQEEKAEQEGIEYTKEFVETFFEEGDYEFLYEASGRSMLGMTQLVEYLMGWLQEKIPDLNAADAKAVESRKAYYKKDRKKK